MPYCNYLVRKKAWDYLTEADRKLVVVLGLFVVFIGLIPPAFLDIKDSTDSEAYLMYCLSFPLNIYCSILLVRYLGIKKPTVKYWLDDTICGNLILVFIYVFFVIDVGVLYIVDGISNWFSAFFMATSLMLIGKIFHVSSGREFDDYRFIFQKLNSFNRLVDKKFFKENFTIIRVLLNLRKNGILPLPSDIRSSELKGMGRGEIKKFLNTQRNMSRPSRLIETMSTEDLEILLEYFGEDVDDPTEALTHSLDDFSNEPMLSC